MTRDKLSQRTTAGPKEPGLPIKTLCCVPLRRRRNGRPLRTTRVLGAGRNMEGGAVAGEVAECQKVTMQELTPALEV